MTEGRMLADKIVEFLDKYCLAGDCNIYFDGMCYHHTAGQEYWKTEDDVYPSDYFDNADGVVCMSFEGDFYSVMNDFSYRANVEYEEEFRTLLKGLGYYYELGNSWNLSIYETR